ncbi:MAG: type II toxin-antitoxin system VapC family toxin [Caulobacteraceae bacterium]|nr:type II toxin-antitoxin system VapC family toxin [Caulobacteraceae bacterium]
MYLDASALVAILVDEPDAVILQEKVLAADSLYTSPVSAWETVVAVARITGASLPAAEDRLAAYLKIAGVEMIAIDGRAGDLALQAFAQYGKGRHPARLNMGDCFAYACAKSLGLPLLYKGEDFALTDIAAA